MHRETLGVIAEDPALTLPVGDQLYFNAVAVFPQDRTGAVWLENWESQEGLLLSIQFRGHQHHRIEGSAVVVAPGVALCATHVIAPHLESMMAGETAALCSGITSSGLLLWHVRNVTSVPSSDLTILGLALASALPAGNIFHQARISTRLPKVGENLVLLGFRSTEPVEGLNPERFRASGNVLMCQGIVTARYDVGRDRVFMPWPVYEVECPSWGGMSGGPAFDRDGNVVGILASSFEGNGEIGPSYVSQIWPALATPFEGGWPAAAFAGRRSLIAMDPRICVIDDRSVLEFVEHADGTNTTRFLDRD